MANSGARLIAASIVTLAGGLIVAGNSIGQNLNSGTGSVGFLVLLAGGITFVVEYLRALRDRT